MKKILSIILVFVMVLSFCACGAKTEDSVIGTWKCIYKLEEASISGAIGDDFSNTIELYKGGTGRIYWQNEVTGKETSNVSLSWEVEDDIITISYSLSIDCVKGYVFDAQSDTLTSVDNTYVFYRQ